MLDLAVRRRGPAAVRVLHVDHGLRAASAAEADHVHRLAASMGVESVVLRAGEPPTTGNVHAWARAERARLAAEAAAECGAISIATAHTRTDLVETALFRLATQPGRRALLAMRPYELGVSGNAGDGSAPQGLLGNAGDGSALQGLLGNAGDGSAPPVVRPLLGITREETMAWCVEHGLRWIDDAANADRRYARARLRHSVTPVLRGLNPRFEEAVVRTLAELEEERAALEAIVGGALPPGTDTITIAELAALPRAVGRLVLRELCERAAGIPCARAGGRLDEVLARAQADRSPFALDIGDGVRVEVRRGSVRAGTSAGPAAPAARPGVS
ncbi:MAG: tRNA lysidine(34) synthetase TilS [Solirubrobacteraceae bacterium]|nr:tRNA lysidine(34) synthetase TilS [Solirubrobacteraceae bacterium]